MSIVPSCKVSELQAQLDRIEAMLKYLFDNARTLNCYHNGQLPPKPE